MDHDQQSRYERAAHGVQTGVALEIESGGTAASPKHLRTGLDLRAADHEGLVRLLLDKGFITEAEYEEAIIQATERERDRYQAAIALRLGRPVTLA